MSHLKLIITVCVASIFSSAYSQPAAGRDKTSILKGDETNGAKADKDGPAPATSKKDAKKDAKKKSPPDDDPPAKNPGFPRGPKPPPAPN